MMLTPNRVAYQSMAGLPAAARERKSIGADCDALRNGLREVAFEMEGLLDGSAKELVRDANRLLKAMACRIAVIGQVKAGKSSLINALIRRPQFLPSDVNPWTTAVTRLHFNQAEQTDVAAEFRFFGANEWDELAVGGGRIRELTERLVPGFEATELGRHLQEMRDHAANRLGAEFTALLGRSHTFHTFDQTTLEAYVCAGQGSARELEGASPGRYSHITKSAHLYLDASPFGFPTTLVDTPGTNDPMLVRDEITRRSLDTADVYIVVLTARQALSNDDVALIRILRGLRKERIIVFVNRIDELADFDAELDAVDRQITKGLQREFVGAEVPIIYGSALWANQAIESASGGRLEQPPAGLRAFQRRLRVADNSHDLGELFFKCSGLPALAAALDASIQQSHPVEVMRHLSTSFAHLADLHRSATQQTVASIKLSLDGAEANVQARQRKMKDLAGANDRLKLTWTTIEQSIVAFQEGLMALAERETRSMSEALWEVVEDFKFEEGQKLDMAMADGRLGPVWQCDTLPLRQKLEIVFNSQYQRAAVAVLQAERTILPQLQKVVTGMLSTPLALSGTDFAPAPLPQPSIGVLSRIVALDLDEPWWKAWWTSKRLAQERAQDLQRIIGDEFAPITADLVRSAREQLTKQIAATVQGVRALSSSVLDHLYRQNEGVMARLDGIGNGVDLAAKPDDAAHDLARLSKQHERWIDVCIKLDTLWQGSQGARPPREF